MPAPPVKLMHVPDCGLQPQALVDSDGTLHLVYLKGEPSACDVFYTRLEKGQTHFSSPMQVNSQPGSAIAVGAVRGAQFALGCNGQVHVVWNGSDKARRKTDGDVPMLYARLDSALSRFEPERNLMGATIHLDGGCSVAADGERRVYVVWHAHARSAAQDEQGRAVFVASSDDEGKTFAPERAVSPSGSGVCPCCGLKAFASNASGLEVLYRAASADGDRDVTLLRSKDRGRSFTSAVLGPWHVSSCPMSTMALGPGLEDSLIAMWETKGQVYHSSLPLSDTAHATAPIPVAGSGSNRKHPSYAVSHGDNPRLLMAWTEGTGWAKGGSLAWECLDLKTGDSFCGRAEGVPVWGGVAVAALGSERFAVIY